MLFYISYYFVADGIQDFCGLTYNDSYLYSTMRLFNGHAMVHTINFLLYKLYSC